MGNTHIEKGAMRRTTCCEFLGPFLRGMSEGSKSGGKYLFNTTRSSVNVAHGTLRMHTFSFRHGCGTERSVDGSAD